MEDYWWGRVKGQGMNLVALQPQYPPSLIQHHHFYRTFTIGKIGFRTVYSVVYHTGQAFCGEFCDQQYQIPFFSQWKLSPQTYQDPNHYTCHRLSRNVTVEWRRKSPDWSLENRPRKFICWYSWLVANFSKSLELTGKTDISRSYNCSY